MPKGATSPRRLSRARQPAPPSHSNSVSSNSSNRAERSTRSNNKASSPQKSSTPQSLISEDPSEEARAATSEPPQLRRSKRQLDNDEDGDTKIEDVVEEEIIEDEETTRCICGHQEYPGLPADPTIGRGAKSSHGANQDEQTDDRGGLFIQCDDCQVWQHGGCVSIMEESAVPDNYYCEECKPDLHELLKSSNG
jgi:DNA mismatch repair ATPase MutL